MQTSCYTRTIPEGSMEEAKELKLHGFWASPFSLKVEVALKIKGLAYEYKEENLEDKSESLLQFNPIYKKVPVLIHHGRPIAESLVILEYIEEMWKDPPLLPKDPYTRARVRFWVDLFYQKFVPPCRSIIVTQGEEQVKAIKESKAFLRTLEEGIGEEFSTDGPLFNGDSPGLLDIVVGSTSCWIKVLGELTGEELVDKERMPRICSCLAAFCELKVMKDTQPNHDELVAYAKKLRHKALAPARA